MLKKRKLLFTVLLIIMVFSTSLVTTFASEEQVIDLPKVYIEDEQLQMNSDIELSNDVNIGGADGIQFKSLDVNSDKSIKMNNIKNLSTEVNNPPVAALKYVIMNPESLVNGNITTNTQIAWLWSYNGENYTYDPDGDAITNRNLGGINQSDIVGMLNGNIGFVTKFSVPAEYVMTYQVTDEKGANSNIYSIHIAVEPTDGNTRPVCSVSYTNAVQALSPVTINWKNSSDSDEGDSITDFRGIVYKNGA